MIATVHPFPGSSDASRVLCCASTRDLDRNPLEPLAFRELEEKISEGLRGGEDGGVVTIERDREDHIEEEVAWVLESAS